jgi:hypothetical protein
VLVNDFVFCFEVKNIYKQFKIQKLFFIYVTSGHFFKLKVTLRKIFPDNKKREKQSISVDGQ